VVALFHCSHHLLVYRRSLKLEISKGSSGNNPKVLLSFYLMVNIVQIHVDITFFSLELQCKLALSVPSVGV